jgi:hypothetical protein
MDIKDIKDLEVVVDYKPFFTVLFIAITALFVMIFFIFKILKQKKKKREKIFKKLNSLDFNNDKELIYNFTIFVKELPQNPLKGEFKKILHNLQKYKYKKSVTLEQKDKESIKEFIKRLKNCKI